MRKHVGNVGRSQAAFAFLTRHVHLKKHVLHLADSLRGRIELRKMAFLVQRVYERGVRHDLGDFARLDVADEMPRFARKRCDLFGKQVGTVFAEVVRTGGNGRAHGIDANRFRDGDDLHVARVAPTRGADAGKLVERVLVMLSEWHGIKPF